MSEAVTVAAAVGGGGMRTRSPGRPREFVLSGLSSRALVAGVVSLAVAVPAASLAASEKNTAASEKNTAVSAASPVHVPWVSWPKLQGPVVPAVQRLSDRPARKRPVRKAPPVRVLGERAVLGPASSSTRPSRSTSRLTTRAVVKRQAARKVSKPAARKATKRVATKRVQTASVRAPRSMAAALRFARAQVGKPYRFGAEGPRAYDCSGFTRAVYRRAGIRLPRVSGAQAARAHRIPRGAARPGDLVVGPGHVGIYMGRGMMIDAGNRRVGVVYRRMYAGLRVERVR